MNEENNNQRKRLINNYFVKQKNNKNIQRNFFKINKRRKSLNFIVLLFLLINYCLLTTIECATFFYGATEDSELPSSEKVEQMQNVVDTNEKALALAESAANSENEQKLSSNELESVYNFCSLLPLLEQSGQIVKNAQARQVCDKLVDMLKPMFRKRNKTIRPRRTNILMIKRQK
ncbi:hypothetical protein Mgra_00002612 [Meloidogyne graminicola]|uniref:Transmembrane protein n=1 Tax=Meloidogyne graminicola TaxID=189291 RepID=A0A8S9ZXF0_9BILA|nr:hypothetical protein Mgra_00002612 [Meloidogyne graminicola]